MSCQDNITDIKNMIEDESPVNTMLQRYLRRPAWLETTTGRLRVSVESTATIATLTTCGTVTTLNQVGGMEILQGSVYRDARSNWGNTVRRCIQ